MRVRCCLQRSRCMRRVARGPRRSGSAPRRCADSRRPVCERARARDRAPRGRLLSVSGGTGMRGSRLATATEIVVDRHVAAAERHSQPQLDRKPAVRSRVLGVRRHGFPEGRQGTLVIEVIQFGRGAGAAAQSTRGWRAPALGRRLSKRAAPAQSFARTGRAP